MVGSFEEPWLEVLKNAPGSAARRVAVPNGPAPNMVTLRIALEVSLPKVIFGILILLNHISSRLHQFHFLNI